MVDDFGILWLQGDASSKIDLAWQTAEKYQHAGLIKTKKGLGVRVKKEDLKKLQEDHGVDATPAFWLKGAPPEMQKEEVTELVNQLGQIS